MIPCKLELYYENSLARFQALFPWLKIIRYTTHSHKRTKHFIKSSLFVKLKISKAATGRYLVNYPKKVE